MRDVVEPGGVDLDALSPAERTQAADDLRRLRNFLRSRTWKSTARALGDLQRAAIQKLGDIGLSADDRAMVCGRLATVSELLDMLPQLVLAADQRPREEQADDDDEALPRGTQVPDLF